MKAKLLIYSRRLSKCCNSKELIVLSRDGGFISRDCMKCCEKSYHVHLKDLPEQKCDQCGAAMKAEINWERNYEYVCKRCHASWVIADRVPKWSERFRYAGLSAPREAA